MKKKYKKKFFNLFGKSKLKKTISRYWNRDLYHRTYIDRTESKNQLLKDPTKAQIEDVYFKTHKFKKEDILNCGSCGYESCEQMATAIINGLNKKENCKHFMEVELLKTHENINNLIISQSSIVDKVTSTIEEISRTIENQDIKITSQSSTVNESSAAIEEMIANIQSISNNLNSSGKVFDDLQKTVNKGSSNIHQLKEIVYELSSKSDKVIEANNIILNIAAQTNLLAMNAAIEAAHVGLAGKGFAVVAEEIRKLAKTSNEQSKHISENIKILKDSVKSVINISEGTGSSFNEIENTVSIVTNLEKEIKNSLTEQATGSNQILEALRNIHQITEEVHTGSSEMLVGGKAVLNDISELIDITEKVRQASIIVGTNSVDK